MKEAVQGLSPPDRSDSASRTLTLTLAGEGTTSASISLSTLAGKLSAAQAALFNVALARTPGRGGARGNWSRDLRSRCELLFQEARTGSVAVQARLPASDALPGLPEPGEEALADFQRVVEALVTGQDNVIADLMPNRTTRARALRSIQQLCPRTGEGLKVMLGNDAVWATLTGETRDAILERFRPDAEDEESAMETIKGQLVEIRVKAGVRHVVVMSHQREIECLYPTEMEDVISQLVAGSIVEVEGIAQLNPDRSVKQIDEILDIVTVDLSSFTIESFRWQQQRFVLREAVLCLPSHQDGLWIYECPRYRLHAFAADRAEALSQLNEEFAFLVEGLFNEDDASLTEDAIRLRDLLHRDIRVVEEDR